ncbi:MAG: hypothetical protein A2V88_08115 [Elusimicrobia bacterium RBG_16_66_12]|nr:MAG: hypothetical protein A2V88_08115 [Elusimicrobia bacterium RBG_16_66_12]
MTRPKILGLIPARGGSKGIPGKNIKPLGGRPLIGWTLDSARQSGVVDRLLVSTDSAEIAAVAAALGTPVPWLRPAELARDESPSIDFVLHALDRLAQEGYAPDAVLLLQPTSPFRSAGSIRKAAELYAKEGVQSLISVSPVRHHPYKSYFREPDGRLKRVIPDAPKTIRRQDLPPVYAADGSIYLDSVARLREGRAFLFPDTLSWLSPEGESLDLDTPQDWAVAEALAARPGQ